MGTPNNPPEPRTVHDVLRDMLRGPEHKVWESDLRTTGVDVDILEAAYETNIRPYLDYLHGYQDLKELDPLEPNRPTRWDAESQLSVYKESWEHLLGRFGQSKQHRQVLQVTGGRMFCYDHNWSGPSNISLAVYLTRKGKWLFWYIEGEGIRGREYTNERISVHASPRELCDAIRVLVPDGFTFKFYGYNRPNYIPLGIEHGLRQILAMTIDRRKEHLGRLKAAQQQATQRLAVVVYD